VEGGWENLLERMYTLPFDQAPTWNVKLQEKKTQKIEDA
jgi:hypothetical protein